MRRHDRFFSDSARNARHCDSSFVLEVQFGLVRLDASNPTMFPRLGRIGFIISRSCFLSLIIIIFVQMLASFNDDDLTDEQLNSGPWGVWLREQKAFWKKLSNDDKGLTDEQRIEQVKLKGIADENRSLNWTRIFWDIYRRKSSKIQERDGKTPYKRLLEFESPSMAQATIDIYEETPVSDGRLSSIDSRMFSSGLW